MGKIISVVSQKGGVGKTTSTINLGAALVKRGQKVLIIDIDPQGNATTGLGVEKSSLNYSTYDVLVNHENVKNVICKTKVKNLDILPTKIDLAGADNELVNSNNTDNNLKDSLVDVKCNY